MQREHLEVSSLNVDWINTDDPPIQPALSIAYTGWKEEFYETIATGDGELVSEKKIDIAYRRQSTPGTPKETGVLSLAHRVTGDLMLEATADTALIRNFSSAVNQYPNTVDTKRAYSVQLRAGSELITTFENQTLLVYDSDGTLLRDQSLIPTGIEI